MRWPCSTPKGGALSTLWYGYYVLSINGFKGNVMLNLCLSHQDDSDEEPSTAAQTPEHEGPMEYVELSCEEGEETTCSEVSEAPPYHFFLFNCLRVPVQSHTFLMCSGKRDGRQRFQ